VLLQLNKFPETASAATKVLFVNFGAKEEQFCLPLVKQLRNAGISAEIFPENAKMNKQMGYANAKKIPFVVIAGENEIVENLVSVKNMNTGEQIKVDVQSLVNYFKL
jgi:histidyl-tRNA synthetase